MSRDYPRSDRVEELAREVLSEAIQELKDPRIGFVTVTSVKVSPDLRNAKVYISALGSEEEREETVEAIRNAGSHLRHVLGSQVRLKHLPRLEFVEDRTADHGARIEQLLREAGVSSAPEVPSYEEDEDEEEPDQ